MCCIRSMNNFRMAHLQFLTHRPGIFRFCHVRKNRLASTLIACCMIVSTRILSVHHELDTSCSGLHIAPWKTPDLGILSCHIRQTNMLCQFAQRIGSTPKDQKTWKHPKRHFFFPVCSPCASFQFIIRFMCFNQTNLHHSLRNTLKVLKFLASHTERRGGIGPFCVWFPPKNGHHIITRGESKRINKRLHENRLQIRATQNDPMKRGYLFCRKQASFEILGRFEYVFCDFAYDPYYHIDHIEHLMLLPKSNSTNL